MHHSPLDEVKFTRWPLVVTEMQLGLLWVSIVSDDRATVLRNVAVEVASGLLKKIKFPFEEKDVQSVLHTVQAKGNLTLALFKKFLALATKDAQVFGALQLCDKLLLGSGLQEELLQWREINFRFYEVVDSHAALHGGKLKKGTLLRVRRKRQHETSAKSQPVDYAGEDQRGNIYFVEGSHLVECEHNKLNAKLLYPFQKLDEERGDPIVSPEAFETDLMGLSLPNAILGVDVATAVARSPNAVGNVPTFLRQCIRFIEQHITEEGLYRIPGGERRINEMCYAINQGRKLILEPGDVENCCSVVVRWLRKLPEGCGVLWNNSTQMYRGDYSAALTLDDKKRVLRQAIHALPVENSATLRFMLRHFKRVASAENKMSLQNLNICIPGNYDIPLLVGMGAELWPDFDAPEPVEEKPAVLLMKSPTIAPRLTHHGASTIPAGVRSLDNSKATGMELPRGSGATSPGGNLELSRDSSRKGDVSPSRDSSVSPGRDSSHTSVVVPRESRGPLDGSRNSVVDGARVRGPSNSADVDSARASMEGSQRGLKAPTPPQRNASPTSSPRLPERSSDRVSPRASPRMTPHSSGTSSPAIGTPTSAPPPSIPRLPTSPAQVALGPGSPKPQTEDIGEAPPPLPPLPELKK